MGRVLQIIFGSAFAGVVGFGAGLLGATLYARHYYPGDPDPVDFTIGGILLWTWFGVWLIGTTLAVWFALRRVAANAP
jgi:hypothetical protein